MVINHPLSASSIYHDPHLLCSFYVPDGLFQQSLSKFSLVYRLTRLPFTLYSIHFFIQSLSSFHNTCPYHCNMFCCSTEIMSSNPSLSLNFLVGILSCSLMPHIHLTIHLCLLKCHLIFLSYGSGLTSMQHTTLHATAVQSPSYFQ